MFYCREKTHTYTGNSTMRIPNDGEILPVHNIVNIHTTSAFNFHSYPKCYNSSLNVSVICSKI